MSSLYSMVLDSTTDEMAVLVNQVAVVSRLDELQDLSCTSCPNDGEKGEGECGEEVSGEGDWDGGGDREGGGGGE